MEKEKNKHQHVIVSIPTKNKIAEFSATTGKKNMEIAEEAFSFFFDSFGNNYDNYKLLEITLSNFFYKSSAITVRSLFTFIYMISKSYPDANAKDFWGEALYHGDAKFTNIELYNKIKEYAEFAKKTYVK